MLGGVLALIVAVLGILVVREARQRRRDAVLLSLLSALGPAVLDSKASPERLVAWAEVARTARSLFPDAFTQLDAAAGGQFPFSQQLVEAAHARWTADWLAWERQHDLKYKQRAAEVESEHEAAGESERNALRDRLAAITQEKLQTYQDRYEHYVRVGKAIAALDEKTGSHSST